MRNIFLILVLVSITACSTSRGFDRGFLRGKINQDLKITEGDIKKAFDAKPQLPTPFKLAIYTNLSRWGSIWNESDQLELEGMKKELVSRNIITDIIYLNSTMIEGRGNKAIRLASARAGADAVIIIKGTGSVDRYNNVLGATYFLIVTPFFIPGTVADGLYLLNASMWDVRNQYLYLSAESEGMASQTRPSFFIEKTQLLAEAKSKAVRKLLQEIQKRIISMQNNG